MRCDPGWVQSPKDQRLCQEARDTGAQPESLVTPLLAQAHVEWVKVHGTPPCGSGELSYPFCTLSCNFALVYIFLCDFAVSYADLERNPPMWVTDEAGLSVLRQMLALRAPPRLSATRAQAEAFLNDDTGEAGCKYWNFVLFIYVVCACVINFCFIFRSA